MINLSDIQQARARFEGNVTETPLVWSQSFSRITGRDVHLKAECMQRAGSFKIRGALNALTRLNGEPVVAASAGNHAQGVALAASFTGSRCTVFMPEIAALPKIKATEDYGADVRLVGLSLADAVDAALDFARATDAHFVHPYDDPAIISGQGTLGLELLEQLPDVGTVVIPTGGGGLLAGTAFALKSMRPSVRVIGVEIESAAVYAESRERGALVKDYPRGLPTIADGIAVSVPSELVWEIAEQTVDDILVVNDAQTTAALAYILDRSKMMVEAAGAVGVAALMEHLIPDAAPDPICIVLSGGNIDLMFLGKAVRHGLEESGRFARYTVLVPDQPGNLASVLQLVAGEGGNVLQVEHHREGFGIPFGEVEIEISVETKDTDHAARIRTTLEPYRHRGRT